ncbi:alpha/beta fold hydrolase (plasmid) [Mesorhizobium sp. NBSH29]|uniref:bifunctional alpha/beta hydrolase/OsmC family protein n=1 Tax=Mesorhizobium sp. NBSH29 TaxID=2654249 RepID=UPI0018965FE9|nr:bifunctional alpha/beta hydrolase/OsmC family protein [Mesorhizobium sp. NBSH29]QPC88821.1 alpha/beta fold hydrolase [Mesorhizobium sp. NBSH29]QPC88947.1 alpha/beta fold hydrolase [Mesorhizobium sp. NBSH29]
MQTERITFQGHSGDTLAARLDLPDGPVRASAIFAHCFTCSKDIPAARRIAARLAMQGIAVLRFDFTGLGHSEGEFANTHFTSNVADLRCAADYLANREMPPKLLIGHSLGGAAVIKVAPDIKGLRAVVTIGAPFEPAHVSNNFGAKLDEIKENGIATVTLAGRDFMIRKDFLDDISTASLQSSLAHLGAALLVLHAPRDATVGIENASEIFLAARHPKSFVTLDDADHLITDEADATYAADIIATWSSRYTGDAKAADASSVPTGVVRVSEHDLAGFRQDIFIGGRHQLLADEPVEVGGMDTGPTPYEFLSAGLGACTAMTIRLYARRKAIQLTHVAIDVRHDRDHRKDCEDCDKSTRKIDRFRRTVRLQGDLSDDQKAALLRIADKCPVHRTLVETSAVETTLEE